MSQTTDPTVSRHVLARLTDAGVDYHVATGKCGATRIECNQLVARRRNTLYFVDDLFEHNSGLCGATGTGISPVSKARRDEQYARYYDAETPDETPIGHLWHESGTTKSFTDWLAEVERYDGDDLLFDPSGGQYWDVVKERASDTPAWADDTEFWTTDCISGGRLFKSADHYDEVYNPDLLELIHDVERNGILVTGGGD